MSPPLHGEITIHVQRLATTVNVSDANAVPTPSIVHQATTTTCWQGLSHSHVKHDHRSHPTVPGYIRTHIPNARKLWRMFEATCDARLMKYTKALTSCLENVGRPRWLRILYQILRKDYCGLTVPPLNQIRDVWFCVGARQLRLQDPDCPRGFAATPSLRSDHIRAMIGNRLVY
jgi:hypothetical protein